MSNELDVEAIANESRRKRFHEHTSVLTAALEQAYMAAGRALINTRIDDVDMRGVLSSQMDTISTLQARAKLMRDMEA